MERVQRKRVKGWKMPDNTVYVGRGTIWGNPFVRGIAGNREEVVRKYRFYLERILKENPYFLRPLEGKDLACWCPLDKVCHADVLLEKLRLENGSNT